MDNQEAKIGSRSIEDIKKEVNNLVDEISKGKSNTENAVENLIDKIEDSFEDAKTQTERGVSELNNKRINLEDIVQSKLDLASDVVKKSINLLKHNYEWVRAEFRKSLAVPLVALIFIVFFYESAISYLPLIDYAVNGIQVVKVMIVLVVLFFTYNSLQKINEKFFVSFENLETTIDYLKRTEFTTKEIKISQQKFEDTRPVLKSVRGILEILILNAGKTVPFMSQAFDELTLLAKFGEKVENFELALNYYGLLEDKVFFARLREFAPAKAHIINGETVWEDSIIEKIIDRLKKRGINVSNDIILLLYREHNGLDTKNIFRTINSSNEELNIVAKILIDSKRLVQPPYNVVYRTEDIVSVLIKVGCFNLSKINNVLSKSLRQLDYLNSYVEFLDKNGINPNLNPNVEFIINEIEDENDEFDYQVVALAYKLGMRVFGEIPSLDEEFIEGFARASISIKFHNEMSFKKYACEISADDKAATVITAYYEKSKEIDRRDAVSLKELIDDLDLVKSSYDKRDDVEFKFLISQLREGNWFDSSNAYLKAFIDATKMEIKEQISKIEKFTILREVVKKTFQKVRIGTVEKAIDAQVFGAYVIMFSSKVGKLAPLVDKLSKRDLEATNRENRWNFKSHDYVKAIEKEYGVVLKYDFMKFSDSTRIGVLNKGESFLDFKNNFLKDIKKILYESKTDEEFGIGLVIQRITPSKYSFGILDYEEPEANVGVKDLDVANYIACLAIDHVPEEEQASVIKLEKDVDLFEIVNMKSVYELIKVENDDIVGRERKILESPDLKEKILEKLGTNLKSLALDLGTGVQSKKEITQVIRDVLESSFSSQLGSKEKSRIRANLLSKRFSDVLEQIALLYG
jgi:hypothetical protein